MCGGTDFTRLRAASARGLSPRVRGNPDPVLKRLDPFRSIPACAGEPSFAWRLQSNTRVYPRVCGGTDQGVQDDALVCGLSPRVRGNPVTVMSAIDRFRSIPACAGEPTSRSRIIWVAWVYPRVCGGTYRRRMRRACQMGLSPRVRGNRRGIRSPSPRSRSIPACAGEPTWPSARWHPWWVYPRVCGGTQDSSITGTPVRGLSPRVRGNRDAQSLGRGCLGSIPACAGEPIDRPWRPPRKRVYPRVCGGTFVVFFADNGPIGLSPRVRGNRRREQNQIRR